MDFSVLQIKPSESPVKSICDTLLNEVVSKEEAQMPEASVNNFEPYGFSLGIDVVGFSIRTVEQQQIIISRLEEVVQKYMDNFSFARNRIRFSPSGDGLFVSFFCMEPDVPVQCAFGLSEKLRKPLGKRPQGEPQGEFDFEVRMGIAAGVLVPTEFLYEKNVVGDAINLAARVLDCGDAWHILTTEGVFYWSERIESQTNVRGVRLGDYEVKHGKILTLYSLYQGQPGEEKVGNRSIPRKNLIRWQSVKTDVLDRDFPSTSELAHLPRLSEIDDGKDHPFLVAESRASLSHQGLKTVAIFQLDKDPRVAMGKKIRVDEKGKWTQRDVLEKDPETKAFPFARQIHAFTRREVENFVCTMRYAAGGAIIVLMCNNKDYIIVGRKDENASIHPMHLIAASGLSVDTQEWLEPDLIIARASAKEVLIAAKDKWLIPEYPEEYTLSASLNDKVKKTVNPLIEKWVAKASVNESGNPSDGHIPTSVQKEVARAEIIHLGADEMGVTLPPHESRSSMGLLVIDPEFGVVDKIGCVTLRVNCNVSGLKLFDGEIDPDGNPLDRDIFLFEPEEFAKLFIPGEQATACYHFRGGRNLRHDREPYMFYPNPKMNPPLLASGIPLLRTVFPTIYGRRKDDLQNISNTERYSVGVDAEKSSGLEPETSHDSLSHS